MGKGTKQKDPPPAAPPVATTGVDSGRRAVDSRKKAKKRYGFEDTLLDETSTGFTAKDLDPEA